MGNEGQHVEGVFPKEDTQSKNILAKRVEIKEALDNGRKIEIYGPIGTDVGENTYSKWESQLDQLGNESPIVIEISTPGGNSAEIIKLDEKVKELREKGLKCYTLGTAYCLSVGIRALMIGRPDGIFVTPDTLLQFHGSTSHIDNEEWVTEEKKEIVRKGRLAHQRNTLYGVIADQTGKDVATIEADTLNDKEFTAAGALEYGLVDGIFYERLTPEEGQARDDALRSH
jgi:ATP-dependent Clp protease, protease subunit